MPPELTEAVRDLRQDLGDTQQSFAHRLGLAIATVVRYESTRAPQGQALALMYRTAIDAGLKNLAQIFWVALHKELGLSESAGNRIDDAAIAVGTAQVRFEMLAETLQAASLSDEQKTLISKIARNLKTAKTTLEALDPYFLVPQKEGKQK